MSRKPSILEKAIRKFEIIREKIIGVDFSTVVDSDLLGLDPKLVSKCSPSGDKYLTSLLNDLSLTGSANILDIGCGKGSAILRMTSFKFKNVDGIELAKHNAEVAKKNFDRLKIKNVRIFNIDAAEFSAYDDYSYFYMYNPFPDVIMKMVIARILKQISAGKRIVIIYNNPVCHKTLIGAGLNLIKTYPDQWGNGINLYSNSNEI